MPEYIDREEVMKIAKNGYHSDFGRSMADLTSLREVLEDTPTADVAEVKHGEWTKDDSDGCFCSFCGWYTDYDYDYVTNNGLGNDDFIYCSHCGARMDGGTNDEM